MAPPKRSKKGADIKKKAAPKKADPLYRSTPKNFNIGGDVRPVKDLSRYVRWPRYVRLQRQRTILYQRLKVPPSVNQFTKPINKNEAVTLFSLLSKYRPETQAVKKQRIKEMAAAAVTPGAVKEGKVPHMLKFGLKHVTGLIEDKKAELVLIACDTDPIELVMWMPALCRKMDVPFMIVKNKARLGTLVHQKTATCVALCSVNKEDKALLTLMKNLATEKFNENADLTRKWGGGIMGLKTQAKLDKRAKAVAIEAAKKAATSGMV